MESIDSNKATRKRRHSSSPKPKPKPRHPTTTADAVTVAKYARGSVEFNTKGVKHKALKKTLEAVHETIVASASQTAATEVLLAGDQGYISTEGSEKVYKINQEEIKRNVDLNTSKNAFDLQLQNFGPYDCLNYSRNGR